MTVKVIHRLDAAVLRVKSDSWAGDALEIRASSKQTGAVVRFKFHGAFRELGSLAEVSKVIRFSYYNNPR